MPRKILEVDPRLTRLIQNFQRNRDAYLDRSSNFGETEVRSEYIDKLFEILSWDVHNKAGKNPNEQEVRRETGPTAGEPDYTFRIAENGRAATPVFFLEAKSVKENLNKPQHIFQAKSYAFSAAQSNLVIAVLTNFDEFKVYRVDDEPKIDDPAEKGLLYSWKFSEYAAQIDKLKIFDKDAVHGGSLFRLGRQGIAVDDRPPVEEPFLNRLTNYRLSIADGIHRKNSKISLFDVNSYTETILNRFVFIRFAEDRGILPNEDLKQVLNQWSRSGGKSSLYTSLLHYFDELDRNFNGRLFYRHDLPKDLSIPDETISKVINDLYPPACPYRFNQIRVELLGEIYERHLGKVISFKGNKVCLEDKPEVRHAKGVYYTPSYIVDAVLERTLRKCLNASKRIEDIFDVTGIDPACGSGSFLLGCYRMIYEEVLSRSIKENNHKFLEENLDGSQRVKFSFKRKILEKCLHGIDIDRRAVKVAELSLYLKLLEDEPDVAKNPIPYLPEMRENLQCANSLLDLSMVRSEKNSTELVERLQPLTWERSGAFKKAMDEGGFSFLATNPPYIRIQELRKFSDEETTVLVENYDVMRDGNPDIYLAFMHRALEKIKDKGHVGFITSNKFTVTNYGQKIRQELSTKHTVTSIVDFGRHQVFKGATTHTCIISIQKRKSKESTPITIVDTEPNPKIFNEGHKGITTSKVDLESFGDQPWEWNKQEIHSQHLNTVRLDEICEIFQGIRTSENEVFVLSKAKKVGSKIIGYSRALGSIVEVEDGLCKPFLRGKEIGRNSPQKITNYLIFPYLEANPYKRISWSKMESKFPLTAVYLKKCKKQLLQRQDGDVESGNWYGYLRQQSHDLISGQKLMVQAMSPRAHISLDKNGEMFFVTGYGIYIKDPDKRTINHYRFIQAILKSKLFDGKIISRTSKLRAGYEYRKQFMQDLPMLVFDPIDKVHLQIVNAQRILEEAAAAIVNNPKSSIADELRFEIERTELEIDKIIEEIYAPISGPNIAA